MAESRTIPGYTLHRVLGRGNTSMVYVATDPEGREVAVKLPHEHTLQTQDAAERFGNEVRLTLKFRHPHLVRGYAGTPFGEQAYLAVQYYDKGALSERLAHLPARKLPPEQALRILADVASALLYLHRQGAVHQDVKTHNVYLDDHGRAALGDLGSTYFTSQGGKVSGSPYYMAPEIYHGESSSSASDIYSLGVLAYELISGERPFRGESYEELMVAHLTRFPPSLHQLAADVPRTVTRLVEQALSKRPHERPSAEKLLGALCSALGEEAPLPGGAPVLALEGPPDPAAKPAGRHAAPAATGPRPEPGPTAPGRSATPAAPAASRWNPFRRKK